MGEIWKNVKPFSYPQKGINGYYNYGYSPKRRTRYYKLKKRKVYRQIRKYGFDATECWNLYHTIMRWLSDNVGGFFRECGDENDWMSRTPCNFTEAMQLFNKRQESYKKHLEKCLMSNDEAYRFIIPRLVYFRNHHVGYPGQFGSNEEWSEILEGMIQGMCQNDNELFVEHFFYLWY